MPTDPKDNMKAAEDFFYLVLCAHIVAAAKTIQSYNAAETASELAQLLVANYLLLPAESDTEEKSQCEDKVFLYACETLTLGLLWHGYYDAIKESDGDGIERYWRFLAIIFKSSNHPNYAKEAVMLLMQSTYLFSERKKAQLLWSRCINTRGVGGGNMPCDLYMEHLNRRLKTTMRGMGGNITPKTIEKAAKAMGTTHQVCSVFEEQTIEVKPASDSHSYPSVQKDLEKMVIMLCEENVFTTIRKREHTCFEKMKCGILQKHSKKILIKKVQETINRIDS